MTVKPLLSLLLLAGCIAPVLPMYRNEEEELIGWKGDTYRPQGSHRTWMRLVSWKPRAYIIHNLITDAEVWPGSPWLLDRCP